ncbi:MAG: circularly permuted type 2 ATP-grasp protein [Methylophilus sp.]
MQPVLNQLYFSDRYNELLDSNGQLRPHWQALVAQLESEAPTAMRQRLEAVQRQVRDNGVTYNVYADTHGVQRPWDLDVLPLIIAQDEWQHIAASVAQRATLLNKVLLDVYGEQHLLESGQLPPALIYGHSGFLSSCVGIPHYDNMALHSYAADIARAPNGQWWVVSDRTQAPTGAGYALENRTIISSAFPDLFRDLNIERLSGFFASMRDSLAHWGHRVAENQARTVTEITPLGAGEPPLVVILTPGPYNETYHEQSFLAGYLGYPLVHGSDLTVRNGVVWLKTVAGLKPIHAILRRIDDDYCDPLELNAGSLLGVAGLAQVARLGNVLIANALGSNLLQSGALLGFLPKLSRSLLGEELRMPSVATWWCGEPAALEYVINNLDYLVIHPAYPQVQSSPVFGEDLNPQQKEALITKLRAQPDHYIAQEPLDISHAPVLVNHPQPQISTLAVSLRVYAFATPNGYAIMPGGLSRVASGKDAREVTMQRGGTSKDTWVLSNSNQPPVSLLRKTNSSHDLVRENTYLSSRMAENLFWYGRYCVRHLQKAIMLRATIRALVEYTPDTRAGEWTTMQGLCQWFDLLSTAKDEEALAPLQYWTDEDIAPLLIQAVFSQQSASLATSVQQLFQQAFNLRERISNDHWRTVNTLSRQFITRHQQPTLQDAMASIELAINHFVTLTGFAMDWMTRDLGWRFMSLGRRIERLQFMCVLLSRALTMPVNSNLEWLLQVTNNLVTYRARYAAQPEWLPVLDLLLMDESNPNAIVFQIKGLLKYLEEMDAQDNAGGIAADLRDCWQALLQLDADQCFHAGNRTLADWLNRTYDVTQSLSDRLGLRFFSYTSPHATPGG